MINRFSLIDDTREVQLILLVHGIGTKEEYQVQHVIDFNKSLRKVHKM